MHTPMPYRASRHHGAGFYHVCGAVPTPLALLFAFASSKPLTLVRQRSPNAEQEQNLVNLQWKGSGSRKDPVVIY